MGKAGKGRGGKQAMIRIENLCKRFGRFEALRGLSFDVPEGSAFAMIGANGAGKTTTIKVLMNILEPTSGSATLLGVDSRKISPRELAQIGYVSENQDMPSRLTVEEYTRYLRPFYPTWDRDLEASIARQLRLPLEQEDRRPVARHADEDGADVRLALSAEIAGPGRAVQWTRSIGSGRIHGRAAESGRRDDHPDLLA